MLQLRHRAKQIVEQFPALARIYREGREAWRFRRETSVSTPWGFVLRGNAAMASGIFESVEIDMFRRISGISDAFVDVGANIGLYSCLAGAAGLPTLCIEPLPENLAYLYCNLQQNRHLRAEVFPVAVGARPGIVDIYGGGTGASLVPGWAGTSRLYRTTVAVSNLDILAGDRFKDSQLCVKVDVEGAEFEVLNGADKLLRRETKPIWVVELCLTEHQPSGIHPAFLSIFERFESLGYSAHTLEPRLRSVTMDDARRWLKARRQDFGGHNFVFLSPEILEPLRLSGIPTESS